MKKKIAAALLCITLALTLFPCAVFAEEPAHAVRVGFFPLSGYHMVDEKGNRSGYGYDLLQQLRVYSNWTYEYIGYDKSWEVMFGMLERGEIDLLTVVHKTQEREALFDFSDEPAGYSSTIIAAKPDSGVSFTGDYKSWNGARVGIAPGNKRNDGFAAFAREHGFSYAPVYFDTTEELIAALKNEEGIDLAVSSDQRAINDEVVLAKFDSEPYYIAVKKGNTELLREINSALKLLVADIPDFRTKLSLEYFSAANKDGIAYTAQERAFIAANADTVFTAALCPDRAPLSDFENGAPVGFLADISAEIITRTGLNIQILETSTRSEYNELIASGSPDIILDAWYNYSNAEQRGFKLAQPYLEVTITRLYLKERGHALDDIHNIAMIRNSDLSLKYGDDLARLYDITYYDTVEEVINAVYSGRQDTAYLFYHTAEKAIYDDLTNRMSTDELYAYSLSFSVAAGNTQDPLLLSILNKAAGSISDSEIENAILEYTSYPLHPFSFLGYLYDNPISSIFILICLFALLMIAALFLYTTKKRRRERAQMLEEQRKNQLLKEALEIAEEAGSSKSRFLSNVSHEMRTPLNAIIGFMTLAEKEDSDPSKMGGYLQNSKIAARQLLSIINDVLDMSAIEAGKMQIANAPFELNQISR